MASASIGLWVKKQMFGNTYMGVQRTTFLIDAKGKIAKIWVVKRAKGHAAEVLEALQIIVGADPWSALALPGG